MTHPAMTHPLVIAPSILAADIARLGEQVRAIDAAGADWIHVDIMDGHFVPEISFGPAVLRATRQATARPLNVHLMVTEPERIVETYARAGADHLIVHAEPAATVHLHRTLGQARELGVKVGVAINPSTPVGWIAPVLHMVDIVLVMTVNPGFGGQKFLPEILPKIAELRTLCADRGLHPRIEVDGGLDRHCIASAVAAGADTIVAGTSIFAQADYTHAIAELRQAAGHQQGVLTT